MPVMAFFTARGEVPRQAKKRQRTVASRWERVTEQLSANLKIMGI